MRAKSTTAQGREHEEKMVKLLSYARPRRSRSSGAQPQDNVDVTSKSFVMECESTDNKSYSLKKSFWEEVKGKSTWDQIPLLGIQFRDPDKNKDVDLIIMDANDFYEIHSIWLMYQRGEL